MSLATFECPSSLGRTRENLFVAIRTVNGLHQTDDVVSMSQRGGAGCQTTKAVAVPINSINGCKVNRRWSIVGRQYEPVLCEVMGCCMLIWTPLSIAKRDPFQNNFQLVSKCFHSRELIYFCVQ